LSSGSSGWRNGSAVGQLANAIGAASPSVASVVASSFILPASQRSVGVASRVEWKYRPATAGAAALRWSLPAVANGPHSTPMTHPAVHGETSLVQVPLAWPRRAAS